MLDMGILAYIDPGSGSLILQAILAGLLSIPFFFRRTIGGAIQRMRGNRADAGTADAAPADAASEADGTERPEH